MLYKVTPMMTPVVPEKKKREPGQPRKRRKTAVYDHEGQEVLITLMCLKCRQIKPLMQFGLRKMADGAIRNQPWCRTCRSGAGAKKPAEAAVPSAVAVLSAPAQLSAAKPPPALHVEEPPVDDEQTQPMAAISEEQTSATP